MAAAGAVVGRCIRTAYRQFLAKVHPDYFAALPEAQGANSRLIQWLGAPVHSLSRSWLDGSRPSLVPGATEVTFYTGCSAAISASIPFVPGRASGPVDPAFRLAATRAVLGLFQLGTVGVSPEVLRYLSLQTGEYAPALPDKEHFLPALEEHERSAGLRRHTPYYRDTWERLARLACLRIDSGLSAAEKREALDSLVGCYETLREWEAVLSHRMPVLFISNNGGLPAATADSIRLPTGLTEAMLDRLMQEHLGNSANNPDKIPP